MDSGYLIEVDGKQSTSCYTPFVHYQECDLEIAKSALLFVDPFEGADKPLKAETFPYKKIEKKLEEVKKEVKSDKKIESILINVKRIK